MRALIIIYFLISTMVSIGQVRYLKTFGRKEDPAIVFLHGGPGYNCAGFESTTAAKLAGQGFFVIVYDRRGEGRSVDRNAAYTFSQSLNDLDSIISAYQISKVSFIGHSFGGVIATKFAEQYPDKINALILVGAPVCLQRSFKHIIKTVQPILEAKKDSNNLKMLAILQKSDTSSLLYSSLCFNLAIGNGFYSPKIMTEEAKTIYAGFRADTALMKFSKQMSATGPAGFWKNEKYTTIDLTSNIKKLIVSGVKIYGLYGKDDGLYSPEEIMELKKILGDNNLLYLDNCSHNVFMDQQTLFLNSLKQWIGK